MIITLVEYAERHGKKLVNLRKKALNGGFKTAFKLGRDWVIDEDEPWVDDRIKTGAYVDWRKKKSPEDDAKPEDNAKEANDG